MKPTYSLSGSLTGATQAGGVWETAQLTLNVSDKEGVWLLAGAAIGDIAYIDTSAYSSGTFAAYRVTSIVSRVGNVMVVNATYNEAGAAPDLSYCVGEAVVVTRPGKGGALTVPAPRAQGLADKLPFSLLGASMQALATPVGAANVAFTNGKLTSLTIRGAAYVLAYGANGLTSITKDGQPYMTVNYVAGQVSSFNLVSAEGVPPVVIDWIPGLAQVATVSQNTLAAIDPKNDPLANPNYPGTPPWERSAAWIHCLDFGSVIMCDDIGTHGTIMFYSAAGHSACNPTMWAGYDIAKRTWSRIGKRPLPTDDMYLGLDSYPGLLDPIWGDYIGAAEGWGAFAQPGYNPPAGSHAYGGLTYRPAAKAGNAGGQILYPLNATGGTAGNASRGSWIWDADTELFERSANLRPVSGGATVGGTEYFESIDSAFALNTAGSTWLMTLDWFDWSSKTWTRRNSQTTLYNVGLSGLSLAHQSASLYIICDVNGGAIKLFAAPVDKVAAGTVWAWSELTVVNSSGDAIPTVAWVWHDTQQCYYGAGYQPSQGHYLYKLAPPGVTQAECLSGTWTITRQTIAGEALVFLDGNGTSTSINNLGFLTYSKKLDCLFWMSNYVGGPVQALQPGV